MLSNPSEKPCLGMKRLNITLQKYMFMNNLLKGGREGVLSVHSLVCKVVPARVVESMSSYLIRPQWRRISFSPFYNKINTLLVKKDVNIILHCQQSASKSMCSVYPSKISLACRHVVMSLC